MASEAATMVEEEIGEQLDATESQNVGAFVEDVEERVEKRVAQLRLVYGNEVEDLAGDAMQEVAGYRETQLRLYDPDFKVKDTGKKGAAAWNEKGGDNSIAIGHEGMQLVKNEGYWLRVSKHELVHQQEQAAEFNLGSIAYPGETVEVNPTLVEWHAITISSQPGSDLVPEYIEHKQRGDALVAFLGSREPLLRALKTGDMQLLQDLIDKRMQEQEKKAA